MKIKELKALIPEEYRDKIYTIREFDFGQDEDRYYIFLKWGYYFENGCGGSYMIATPSMDDMISSLKDSKRLISGWIPSTTDYRYNC